MNFLIVAAGGALGAAGRYGTGLAVARWFGAGFPWGTLAVNVIGSFLMGALAVALSQRAGQSPRAALFLLTGILGGFTTFSAFSLDAVALIERGRILAAGGYIGGSVILSITALVLGALMMRAMA
ncbi:fluoride efflux transporter CrcB [Abyssibius alkaniclasticus]|uniref:fluoride efflux transporter CrcB n=1 Tax=Abyssibius alkaniclasticus TaxID=2881234 RepID=UPI0040584C31